MHHLSQQPGVIPQFLELSLP